MPKTLLFALVAIFAMALALTGVPVQADTLTGNLHGFCTTASDCSATSVNGNPVIQFNGSAQFGFWAASGPETGDDILVILVPNVPTTLVATHITVDESNTGSSTGSANLVSTTFWSSGFLDNYLGLSASPANPFNNYGGPSGIDSSATAFLVYELDLGNQTVPNQANESSGPLFTVPGGLAAGDFALDFLCPSAGDPPPSCIGTPNSEALESAGPNTPPSVPEPSSLSMLGFGLLSMVGFARKRLAA